VAGECVSGVCGMAVASGIVVRGVEDEKDDGDGGALHFKNSG
jgi:hypothetical protein